MRIAAALLFPFLQAAANDGVEALNHAIEANNEAEADNYGEAGHANADGPDWAALLVEELRKSSRHA